MEVGLDAFNWLDEMVGDRGEDNPFEPPPIKVVKKKKKHWVGHVFL